MQTRFYDMQCRHDQVLFSLDSAATTGCNYNWILGTLSGKQTGGLVVGSIMQSNILSINSLKT